MKKWDSYETEYILNHNGRFDEKEVIHFKETDDIINRMGKSIIRHPNKRTLVIPSVHGCCLIFEGLHFVIDKE